MAFCFILLVLVLTVPWRQTMPGAGLDPSWTMVLARAFENGWQFGADISFTYGPLGSLGVAAFFPKLYGFSLLYWGAFLAAMSAAICLLCRAAGAARWTLLVAAAMLTCFGWLHDAHVFAATFILFLVSRSQNPVRVAITCGLAVLLALAAHMKLTYAMLSVPIIIVADIARYVEWRAKPVLTPLYLGAYAAAYLAAGQSAAVFWEYATGALEIARGYNEAMFTSGRPGEIPAYGALVFAAAALIGWVEWGAGESRARVRAFLSVAAFGMMAAVVGKAAFTRHDDAHAVLAWSVLALCLPVYLGAIDRRGAVARLPRALLGLTAAGSVIALLASYVAARPNPGEQPAAYIAQLVASQFIGNAATVGDLVFDDGYAKMVSAYTAAIEEIRTQSPLPAFSGTTDIFGNQQSILLAHGADYRPRPVFQSYSVYTPELIRRNIAFLGSARAPQTILFKFSYIDGRFPALDEGALLPTLLRLYDISNVEHGYAVLTRRDAPRDIVLEPLSETAVSFDEKLDVSAWNEDLLWVELEFHPTLLGKIRSALLKASRVTLNVTGNDQPETAYRIIPAITGQGFLLSPIMFAPEHLTRPAAQQTRVTHLSLSRDSAGAFDFEDRISVRLKRLRIPQE